MVIALSSVDVPDPIAGKHTDTPGNMINLWHTAAHRTHTHTSVP